MHVCKVMMSASKAEQTPTLAKGGYGRHRCQWVEDHLIVTYFRGNLISRGGGGHISRDLNFAIWPKKIR